MRSEAKFYDGFLDPAGIHDQTVSSTIPQDTGRSKEVRTITPTGGREQNCIVIVEQARV